jgi:two-component system response regulator FixJ
MSKGNIAVVDDDQGVLDSVVSLLTLDGYAVTGFSTAGAFLLAAPDLSLDCLVTDLCMPLIDGLSLIVRMQGLGLGAVPIVVVSGNVNVPIAVTAMQLGAMMVLEKPFPPAQLLDVVAKLIDRAKASVIPETAASSPEDAAIRRCYETLSPRENVVLSHLLLGSSSKVTAIALKISPRTVDIFRANILRKMKAPNLAAVAMQVSKAGLHLPSPLSGADR